MVSQKVDANWDDFVERMSAGLPVTASGEKLRSENRERSKNPFSPKSRFASRLDQAEDDGLQVVGSGSTTPQTWNDRLMPRPLNVPLRVSIGDAKSAISSRSSRNPFSARPEHSDAEGLQVVSPMTPGSYEWNLHPTPMSLRTPQSSSTTLNPWTGGPSTSNGSNGSNNPFSAQPRHSDAEGMQAVMSILSAREVNEILDPYAVSSPNSSLPYPLYRDPNNNQSGRQWGESWSQVLQPPSVNAEFVRPGSLQPRAQWPAHAGLRDNSYPRSPNDEILIAIFGMTGTGKTTFIEKVSGQKLKIGHNLRSCTMNIEKIHCKVGTYNITLVDTPGFDDTSRSDTEVLILIANWLRDSYKDRTFLSGIIYLHRISDPRMSGSSIKNLRMFRKLCGAESMGNVSLVTTMWDKVSPLEGETREQDLMNGENGFWAAMIASGCLVRRHDGSAGSAQQLIMNLAQNCPIMLRLQEEIAEGKRLIETEAGVSLNEEIIRVQRQHEEELRSVKEEMERAMKTGNEALQKELEHQHAQVVKDIEDRASQQAALLNTRTWDLEDQIHAEKCKNREEQASLERQVETLGEEQMRSFFAQEDLMEQVRALKRMLAQQGRRRMGEDEYYKKWVCTRVFCRRAFYAPRDQKQIWCFYCGKAFKT